MNKPRGFAIERERSFFPRKYAVFDSQTRDVFMRWQKGLFSAATVEWKSFQGTIRRVSPRFFTLIDRPFTSLVDSKAREIARVDGGRPSTITTGGEQFSFRKFGGMPDTEMYTQTTLISIYDKAGEIVRLDKEEMSGLLLRQLECAEVLTALALDYCLDGHPDT